MHHVKDWNEWAAKMTQKYPLKKYFLIQSEIEPKKENWMKICKNCIDTGESYDGVKLYALEKK